MAYCGIGVALRRWSIIRLIIGRVCGVTTENGKNVSRKIWNHIELYPCNLLFGKLVLQNFNYVLYDISHKANSLNRKTEKSDTEVADQPKEKCNGYQIWVDISLLDKRCKTSKIFPRKLTARYLAFWQLHLPTSLVWFVTPCIKRKYTYFCLICEYLNMLFQHLQMPFVSCFGDQKIIFCILKQHIWYRVDFSSGA